MAILSPSFVFGVIVLLYLTSFLFFAILRILTGLSIQRIGYFSLRRLQYVRKDGVKVEIRGLGLNLHRPSFGQPTWISIVLSELVVTVDLEVLQNRKNLGHESKHMEEKSLSDESEDENAQGDRGQKSNEVPGGAPRKSWDEINKIKERLKRLHRSIAWLRLVDIVATNSTLTILDVGTIQIRTFTVAVDTRKKPNNQGHIFTRMNQDKKKNNPAEWIVTVRNVLLTAEGQESHEILDNATLNIHGYLFKDVDGLREAEIELKLGRVHLPMDEVEMCLESFKRCTKSTSKPHQEDDTETPLSDIKIETGSLRQSSVHSEYEDGADVDEFLTSMLRGIKEIHYAVSHIGLTRKIRTVQPGDTRLYFSAVMQEVGVDVHRLESKSPAHRMYFSPHTIAHEALLAALSIAISVDDGQGKSDRLVYIPMATTTMRTTLPSKVIGSQPGRSADERNANILFANIVVTSPSVDLDPKHLPLIVALMEPRPTAKKHSVWESQQMISRYLPKATIKFSMHEPVFRIALPPADPAAADDDSDLIISSISSVALDMESSHSGQAETNYALGASFRVQSQDLYYQTSSGVRYDLLETDLMELKFQLNATPKISVVASGNLQTFSVRMIRPELSDGIREIVRQLRTTVEPDLGRKPKKARELNLVRALPQWLVLFQFEANNFTVEVADVDRDISDDTRGAALQADSFRIDYRAHKDEFVHRRPSRRRAGSRSLTPDADSVRNAQLEDRIHSTDGRNLSLQVQGLEGYIVETVDNWEAEPFLAIPLFEIAASTSSDSQGPVFNIESFVKTLMLQYSLFRHYSIAIAATVLRKAFVHTKADLALDSKKKPPNAVPPSDFLSPPGHARSAQHALYSDAAYRLPMDELVTAELRVMLVQVRATMPSDPAMMLQIYGVEAGKHRYSSPYFAAKLARLYVEEPSLKKIWLRIVSIKNVQVDLKTANYPANLKATEEERVIEISTAAIRFAVPHQLVLHKVFDNIVNTAKTVEQLHHKFITGTTEYILEKKPEGPKQVPKISLRSKAFLFELEDGAFEWKLGNIYRAGLIEQQQRHAREEGFRVKARKIAEEEQRRGDATRVRARSAHPRGRTAGDQTSHQRSRSEDFTQKRGRSRSKGRYHRMRYDPVGSAGMTGSAKVSIEKAHETLKQYNAKSWKQRIDHAYSVQMNSMRALRGVFWGADELPGNMEDTEDILDVPQRPGLMSTLISDLHISIDKPNFPLSELPEFMHRIGKGMPYDMKYSLLIPMHVKLDMGECRMSLRDYPLPFIHVPAMKPGQSHRVPSWSLETNFVIAEEFRGLPSVRHVKVQVVPPLHATPEKHGHRGFSVDVRRTVSPVKTYSDMEVDINTAFPTRITWGASYQPVIQDMMMVIEGFTKPQIDPSDRVGFWDKIRLSFHSRVLVSWKSDGDVHLLLKGTRDPYAVTGNGAGFLMCWRNDVKWSLWRENDPKKFMTVDSSDYILAIPDLSQQALAAVAGKDGETMGHGESYKKGAIFKKVIMKLSGNVRWLAGLTFERNIVGDRRSFNFIPHYNVILKETRFAKAPPGEEYDAFRGFRSNHIHLSLAVSAPRDREWAAHNLVPSDSYNSVHLTPRFFTHFFAWWSMFGGTMSLPIRQGRLWPGVEKSSKKFGRHLATIKYSILLAPLFLSHVYKHKEAEDYLHDDVAVTGLKIRLDSFMLDIHQRREWFKTQAMSRKTQARTSGMKIHRAQLDLISADVRALSATISGTTPESLRKASAVPSARAEMDTTNLSQFTIPDNDLSWIDMDDFVELDWILPSDANPETRIIPLAYTPGFSYFRNTDHGDTISGDPDRSSPFGNEPTHYCVMSKDDDPRKVQCYLIKKRLDQLEEQVEEHKWKMRQVELRNVQSIEGDDEARTELEQMRSYDTVLKGKKKFLLARLRNMEGRIEKNVVNAVPQANVDGDACSLNDDDKSSQSSMPENNVPPTEFVEDFNNRFVIHNLQLKWNNSLRNNILRYIHQVGQRRGFVYYLSRRAVKFILDIVDEQNKAKAPKSRAQSAPSHGHSAPPPAPMAEELGSEFDLEERIRGLLEDSKRFVDAGDSRDFKNVPRPSIENLVSNIGNDFVPRNSYHLRLIAPQIQLQSDKNPKSVALVAAQGMELKIVEVMDKDRLFDEVSGLVQRRFSVEMDGTQFFVTHKNLFKSPLLKLYSGSHYGTRKGSAWPPWVPMEVMFDFEVDPFGFKRIIQKTSASLRYDKYNTLRLKYNDEVDRKDNVAAGNLDSRLDHLWVHFPTIKAICDSQQYYTMYIIVLDLLLYSEPLEKTRSQKLEMIMLASDFSDLRGAPEMVTRLQERIRQLEEIKTHFQIHSNFLDKQAWEDRIMLDRDLSACEDELFFVMKAITTSQNKYDDTQNNGLLRWNIASDQIVWHLMKDTDHPLVEFQLMKAEYGRTDNSDGSHVNLMQIDNIIGLNLLPNAKYPEMIAPYHEPKHKGAYVDGQGNEQEQMLRIYWSMPEAIAGIPVMDHFEVNLHPLKLNLEEEVGKRLFEYIFPNSESIGMPKEMPPVVAQDIEDKDTNDASSSSHSFGSQDDVGRDTSHHKRTQSQDLRLQPTVNSEGGAKAAIDQKTPKGPGRMGKHAKKTVKRQSSMPSLLNNSGGLSRTNTDNLDENHEGTKGTRHLSRLRNGKAAAPTSDDLTEMLSRASKNMTLTYVKIPSVVILLSFNGGRLRNLRNLKITMPTLESRNRYWSNLDLALYLQSEFKKAALRHVPAIFKNILLSILEYLTSSSPHKKDARYIEGPQRPTSSQTSLPQSSRSYGTWNSLRPTSAGSASAFSGQTGGRHHPLSLTQSGETGLSAHSAESYTSRPPESERKVNGNASSPVSMRRKAGSFLGIRGSRTRKDEASSSRSLSSRPRSSTDSGATTLSTGEKGAAANSIPKPGFLRTNNAM